MKQIFKLTNRTAIYHGNGKYTVIADEGFALRGKNGMLCKEITTTDYNQFEVVEDKDNKAAQEAAKVKELEILNNKKAFGTLSTIMEMACDLNKLRDDDERLEALDKKLREDYPSCDFEEIFPPVAVRANTQPTRRRHQQRTKSPQTKARNPLTRPKHQQKSRRSLPTNSQPRSSPRPRK